MLSVRTWAGAGARAGGFSTGSPPTSSFGVNADAPLTRPAYVSALLCELFAKYAYRVQRQAAQEAYVYLDGRDYCALKL